MSSKRVTSLGTEPTMKILIRLALPSIASLLINATYNIVDSLFVGRYVGTLGLAAVGLNFPLFIFLIAVGVLVGVGGSALISRSLGQGDEKTAARGLGSSAVLLLAFGAFLLAIFVPFSASWVRLLGARGDAFEYARLYFSIVALGSPFVIANQALNNLVYAEGNGLVGFLTLAFSSLMNILLDWLFIAVFGWGIAGAAWATFAAQGAGTIALIIYFLHPSSHLKLSLRSGRKYIKEILRIGSSAALRTFSVVFLGITVNLQAFTTEEDLGIAVSSVVYRVISLIVLPAFGINQAFLPIAAYNYGAGQNHRVIQVSRQAVLLALGVCYSMVAGVVASAEILAGLFNREPAFIAMASEGFRTAFLMTPLLIFNLVGSGIFQAVGNGRRSMLIAVSRILFFVLPLLIILPGFFGIRGIWYAFPAGELLSALFALSLSLPVLRSLSDGSLKRKG